MTLSPTTTTKTKGRNLNGGRPRSGPMASWEDYSIGLVIPVNSLVPCKRNTRVRRDLRPGDIQNVSGASRGLCGGKELVVQEVPIPYFHVLYGVVSLVFCPATSPPIGLTVVFSVKPKATWALLKPHFQKLVLSYVFPQLSFTPDRKELWDTDPTDYVRTSVGV